MSKGGTRKHGRHKTRRPSAKAYIAEGRRNKNKVKNLRKHLIKHSNDKYNAQNLESVKLGKPGQIADYKLKHIAPEKLKQHLADKRWREWLCCPQF